MSEEEKLSLNSYIEVLFQGFQFGDILFGAEHSMELYNLINKVLNENQKLKKQLEIKHDGFMSSVEESCELAKENQELKKQLEVGEQQYNDLVEEKEGLQEQLDYLRSGEYYNQLRFERDMLQDIVDKSEVSKEDKEFIDMTHRNTELLEENQQLKEIHDKAIKFIKNHIQETTYKYVYSNEVNVIQELHLDNEELIELLEILERSDNN